jgi:ribosome-associated protein
MQSLEIAKSAAAALEKKKGEDVKIIDISGISDFADYFVIATGNNPNQLDAMEEAVGESLDKVNAVHKNTEGNRDSSWILMDYGDVIIHIFDKESRAFYDLDRIWKDGKTVE